MANNDLHAGHRSRMFKKYFENGINCFEDHEKLEILLFYIFTRINTNDLAHMLLNRFGSLNGVLNAPVSELQEIDGIGANAALKIHFLSDFFQELEKVEPKLIVLETVKDTADYCRTIFSFKAEEQMTALFLDRNHTLIGTYNIKDNRPNSVTINTAEFSKKVIESKCSYVILAHSHITTPALPSDSDFITTRKIANTLKLLGVELQDHLIIGKTTEYSFRMSGQLKDIWP
ncbi:MAG: RadC family protein [Oscillospiraceae bacterium]